MLYMYVLRAYVWPYMYNYVEAKDQCQVFSPFLGVGETETASESGAH